MGPEGLMRAFQSGGNISSILGASGGSISSMLAMPHFDPLTGEFSFDKSEEEEAPKVDWTGAEFDENGVLLNYR